MTLMRTIETERLILRPFTENDLDEWSRLVFADPEVIRYLPPPRHPPRERTERMYRHVLENWSRFGFGEWAVTERTDGRLLGHCGLNRLTETNEVEVDYAIGREFWGRGLATEAARASIAFGFEEARLDRVIGLVLADNLASRKVLENIGMTFVKEARYFGLDLLYYEIARPGA